MKIAIFCRNTSQQELIKHSINKLIEDVELTFDNADTTTQARFNADEFQLLITFDLAGFQLKTLTNNIWYNLLPCKQMHIITTCKNELMDYLNSPLSISMFFFCVTEEQKNTLNTKFENIPWLRVLNSWQENPTKALSDALATVILECGIK